MRTTVEINETKLLRVMKLTGLPTRKAALDFALTVAEKNLLLLDFASNPFYVTNGPVVFDGYDVAAIRKR